MLSSSYLEHALVECRGEEVVGVDAVLLCAVKEGEAVGTARLVEGCGADRSKPPPARSVVMCGGWWLPTLPEAYTGHSSSNGKVQAC